MDFRISILLWWLVISWFSLSLGENVDVKVEGETSIATTDDNFVCATLDWWPESKCDYNQCPWGQAGILNLDFNNTILLNAVKAFNPLRIRLGGSLQDQVVYKVGPAITKCPHFKRRKDGLFGFSYGCLPMERWDEIHTFLNKTGVLLTFSLNALFGKKRLRANGTLYVGDWNTYNARHLMKYTIAKGYKIHSYELGNELCASGMAARTEARQYGKDIVALKKLVKELYPDATTQPKVLGPAGFYNKQWFKTFLEVTGPNVVDAVTHHIYNLGAAHTYKDISATIKTFGPWSEAWVGESGGAFTSGGKGVSHSFANGFWYLDQLGMTATHNHKVFCRQALTGGNYALLNTTTLIPNPDYYGALLWHRLMGRNVLSTTHTGSPYLRAYSHCSKKSPGITLMLIYMSNSTTFSVSVVDHLNMYPNPQKLTADSQAAQLREEYHLTPKDGDILSDEVLANGIPLGLTQSLDIPATNPKLVDFSTPITISSNSIVFATLRNFNAPACA